MHVGYLLGLLLGSAAASPLAEPATPAAAAFCSVVTGLVTKAEAQKPATSYCSSFLGNQNTHGHDYRSLGRVSFQTHKFSYPWYCLQDT